MLSQNCILSHSHDMRTGMVSQMVKNPPAMQETGVQSLGWEDPLEKRMVTHSIQYSCLENLTEEPGRLQSMRW